jgi:hypothetical protein
MNIRTIDSPPKLEYVIKIKRIIFNVVSYYLSVPFYSRLFIHINFVVFPFVSYFIYLHIKYTLQKME